MKAVICRKGCRNFKFRATGKNPYVTTVIKMTLEVLTGGVQAGERFRIMVEIYDKNSRFA